jgi:hypothetical protein
VRQVKSSIESSGIGIRERENLVEYDSIRKLMRSGAYESSQSSASFSSAHCHTDRVGSHRDSFHRRVDTVDRPRRWFLIAAIRREDSFQC